MTIEFNELPDWYFVVDEISAGVYKACGKDKAGRSVEVTGTDPNVLIEECKKSATRMIRNKKKAV